MSAAPHQWSTTALDNQTADPRAKFPVGMPASALDDACRALMQSGALARNDHLGTLVATIGPNNVYSVTTNEGLIDPLSIVGGGTAKISKPFLIRVVFPAMNTPVATARPTIIIDAAAAVPLKRQDGTDLADGDLSGVPYEILGDTIASGAYGRARILDVLASQIVALAPNTFPIGGILPFTGSNTPVGFLVANGAVLSRVSYPKLWAHAQVSGLLAGEGDWNNSFSLQSFYSSGDGSATFRLPALTGLFLRGLDAGRGLDPGRQLGTSQGDAFRSHNHGMANGGAPLTLYGGPNTAYISVGNPNNGYFADSIAAAGGPETRPYNAAYPFLIRAY